MVAMAKPLFRMITSINIYNLILMDRKLRQINIRAHKQDQLSLKNGKVSLTQSLRNCPRCDRLTTELTGVRKEVARLAQ